MTEQAQLVSQLEGMCFVIMGPERQWQYQGQIHAEVGDGFFLVRYFEAVMGFPNDFAIYQLADMRPGMADGCWKLFKDDADLRDWIEDRTKR